MTRLRQKFIEDLEVRNYSPSTIRAYVRHVAVFAKYFSQSPDRLGRQQIHHYQLYLVRECKLATPTVSQIVAGLRFFYETTLGRKWISEQIPYPRHERRLPTVLSRAEVSVLLDTPRNLKAPRPVDDALRSRPARVRTRHSTTRRYRFAEKVHSRASRKKDAKTGKPCCPTGCWQPCVPTGKFRGPPSGYFPVRTRSGRSPRMPCGWCATKRPQKPSSPSTSVRTYCVIASPRTCWKTALICARSRCFSATGIWKQPPSIYTCLPRRRVRRAVPWIG